jgi:hypothetical protein
MIKSESNNQVVKSFPDLLTESELVEYLRIAEVSKAAEYKHVVANLIRVHGLPRIHICRQPLYPLQAIRRWVREKLAKEQRCEF